MTIVSLGQGGQAPSLSDWVEHCHLEQVQLDFVTSGCCPVQRPMKVIMRETLSADESDLLLVDDGSKGDSYVLQHRRSRMAEAWEPRSFQTARMGSSQALSPGWGKD